MLAFRRIVSPDKKPDARSMTAAILIASLSAIVNSTTFAQNAAWVETFAGTPYWQCVASSSNGTKLAAAPNGGLIFTSAYSGRGWTPRTPYSEFWTSIASSADGTTLVAAEGNGYYDGGIFISKDSGVIWQQTAASTNIFWTSVACSSDGATLFGAGYNNSIYISTDSGATWTKTAAPTVAPGATWTGIACSADGTKLVAAYQLSNGYGNIYTSTDSGSSWTETSLFPNQGWCVACSSDGTKMVASGNGYIFTSSNSGGTWTPQIGSPFQDCFSIASSADGKTLVAASMNALFVSPDSGVTWIQTFANTNVYFEAVAISSDGTKSVAVSTSPGGTTNGIWISQYEIPPYPVLRVAQTVTKSPATSIVTPSASNLMPGLTYQLQATSDLNHWANFGAPFDAAVTSWKSPSSWNVANTNRLFFRMSFNPQ